MATIDDLCISISEMPKADAFNLIRKIRQSRLTKKITKFTIRAKRKTKARVKKNPLEAVTKAELLKMLKESINE